MEGGSIILFRKSLASHPSASGVITTATVKQLLVGFFIITTPIRCAHLNSLIPAMINREHPTRHSWKRHSWKRRWRRWREMKHGRSPTEIVESYAEIDRFPALVLWGEPGFGKSHELLQAYDALGPQYATFVNLRSITRAEDLRQALDEWERIWFLDQPSHMVPYRTHGGIL